MKVVKSFFKHFGLEIAIYICIVILLHLLPWNPPLVLQWTGNQGTLSLTLEKPDGTFIERNLDLSKISSPLNIYSQRIKNISSTQEVRVSPVIHPIDKIRIFSAILITAGFFLGIFIYFRTLVKRSLHAGKSYRDLICLGLNLALFGTIFFTFTPGLLNFDSLFYYQKAATFQFSEFMGFYFNSFMLGLYQLIPYPWILPVLNVILVSVFLTHLFIVSRELNTSKYYYIACLIFYLYPANHLMVIAASRDILSHWIMAIYMIELYLMFARHETDQAIQVRMAFGAALLTVIRPETVYVLLPYLVFLTWKYSRVHLRWAGLTILLSFGFILLKEGTYFATKRKSIWKKHYETTLLVNPLSYILSKKYPSGLPQEVSEKLGTFFKNDYLVKYQDDIDIPAFHKGGINSSATVEDYEKFRDASIYIFLSNPYLFIENRLKISRTMFGFSDKTSFVSNEYHLPEQERKKIQLGFHDYQQSAWGIKFLNAFNVYKPILTKSYILPFLVILISLFFTNKQGWYRRILFFFLVRTLLVMAITPGGYFKYNYSLWLFPIFMLPMLVWEYRNNKNPDPVHGT